MRPLILVTALFIPALATSAPAPVKADGPADPAKLVCKEQRIEGTRFMKRVCLTRAAWAELEQRRNAAVGPSGFAFPEPSAANTPSEGGRPMSMQMH